MNIGVTYFIGCSVAVSIDFIAIDFIMSERRLVALAFATGRP
jgi:hypothetical protein